MEETDTGRDALGREAAAVATNCGGDGNWEIGEVGMGWASCDQPLFWLARMEGLAAIGQIDRHQHRLVGCLVLEGTHCVARMRLESAFGWQLGK